jgi:hypothetical protein
VKKLALLPLITSLFTVVSNAQSVTIANASFETATLPLNGGNGAYSNLIAGSTLAATAGTVANWTAAASTTNADAGGYVPASGGINWTSKWWSGSNIVFMQINSPGTVSLSQTLAATLQNNTTYTLAAKVGRRIYTQRFDYSLQLWAGSTLLSSASNLALASNTSGTDQLLYYTGVNNPLAGQPLTIVLASTGIGGSFTEAFFDDVSLTTSNGSTIPIPNITGLDPTSGIAGTPVTITGANFGASQTSSTVKFNGVAALATIWSATSITVTVPAGATTGNVVVTVVGQPSNAVPFTVRTGILNMSHDLTTLGIANQNIVPNNPSLDARPLFQAALNYVQLHPVQTLTWDAGNYYFLSDTQSNAVLNILQLSNLTIDLAGATIYLHGGYMPNGINVVNCTNLTLTNFKTDLIDPAYTHVTLTSVDTTNRLLMYQTIPGWRDPATFASIPLPAGVTPSNWAAVFRNGNIVPGTARMQLNRPISAGTLSLLQDFTPWTQSPILSTLQGGDTVVVTNDVSGPEIEIWECNQMTLSNVTIYGSPSWGVQVFASSNTTVDSVRVEPRPGTGLIGANADGIHFVSVRQNDHIRNSYVARTMDDALTMDNQLVASVVSQTGARQLRVNRPGYLRFPNGTAVNFVDPVSTLEITGATIVSQNPADSVLPGLVDLTVDQDLPALTAGMAMVYADPSMRGQGSTIEDNIVEDTYGGRGVWLSGTVGVTVQRNVIRRSDLGAIESDQDTLAYIGPPSRNVIIQNNSLESDLGPAAAGTGTIAGLASIEVISINSQPFATDSSNSNVSIQNNYICAAGRSGIWVGQLNGGSIQNNMILGWNEQPMDLFGFPGGVVSDQVIQDFSLPIVLHNNVSITNQNNVTNSSAPSTCSPVTFDTSSFQVGGGAGSGSFSVTPAVAGFAWNAVSSVSWITIVSSASGSGSGSVGFSVDANPFASPRTGTISVAGQTVVITQSGFKRILGQVTSQ